MKKFQYLLYSGCVFSWLIASMNPVTKIIDQSTYSYFNYQLMAIGFDLLVVILLWVIKKKTSKVKFYYRSNKICLLFIKDWKNFREVVILVVYSNKEHDLNKK